MYGNHIEEVFAGTYYLMNPFSTFDPELFKDLDRAAGPAYTQEAVSIADVVQEIGKDVFALKQQNGMK